MIVGFADAEKPKYAADLSTIMAMIFHLGLDFRNKDKPIYNFDEDFMECVKKYIAIVVIKKSLCSRYGEIIKLLMNNLLKVLRFS